MENPNGLTPEERKKTFELELNNAPVDARVRYAQLVLDERLKEAPSGTLSLELKERLLGIARANPDIETARKALKMAQKMERDWERASRGGRPPIGGAVDD